MPQSKLSLRNFLSIFQFHSQITVRAGISARIQLGCTSSRSELDRTNPSNLFLDLVRLPKARKTRQLHFQRGCNIRTCLPSLCKQHSGQSTRTGNLDPNGHLGHHNHNVLIQERKILNLKSGEHLLRILRILLRPPDWCFSFHMSRRHSLGSIANLYLTHCNEDLPEPKEERTRDRNTMQPQFSTQVSYIQHHTHSVYQAIQLIAKRFNRPIPLIRAIVQHTR